MKKCSFCILLVLLSILIFPKSLEAIEPSFVVLIPSSNNKEWLKRNLDSVLCQSYSNYRIVYIDDASTDGTADLLREYIRKNSLDKRLQLLHNEIPEGPISCIAKAVQICAPHEIIVLLPGSDWFANRQALEQLSAIYQDPDVWVTYGQYCYYPSYSVGNADLILPHIIEQNTFSDHPQSTLGFKTFYAWLFQQIRIEDLHVDNVFNPSENNLVLSLPTLELAGIHSRFIPEINYICNSSKDFSLKQPLLNELKPHLSRKKYSPIAATSQNIPLKKVYITPGYWGELFSIGNPIFNRDNCLDVLYRLRDVARQAGYELMQAHSLEDLHDFEYLVVFDVFPDQLEILSHYPKEKKILFLWEPPSVIAENYDLANHSQFSKVYTWHDGLVDNQKYFKFFYPVMFPMIDNTQSFASKKLCTLICANKYSSFSEELYSERRHLIQFYEDSPYDDFVLFGKGWPYSLRNYGGPIEKKVDCLKSFRFCYAYENIKNIPGYITEKIFDCFHAGTIPIYWGANNIDQYIPKNCYLHREDFQSDEALHSYLKNMDEVTYQQYLNNIRLFLLSDEAKCYSPEHFIAQFMKLLTNE